MMLLWCTGMKVRDWVICTHSPHVQSDGAREREGRGGLFKMFYVMHGIWREFR